MDKLENVLTPCCNTVQETIEFNSDNLLMANCPGCEDSFLVRDLQELSAIYIDREWLEVVDQNNYGNLPMLELEDGTEWYIAESWEQAGEEAANYWRNMARDDPEEFTCMVGKENLVSWALGQYAGPGSTQVQSLEEWFELWEESPEEHFGSYDNSYTEIDGEEITNSLLTDLGFSSGDIVIFRHN